MQEKKQLAHNQKKVGAFTSCDFKGALMVRIEAMARLRGEMVGYLLEAALPMEWHIPGFEEHKNLSPTGQEALLWLREKMTDPLRDSFYRNRSGDQDALQFFQNDFKNRNSQELAYHGAEIEGFGEHWGQPSEQVLLNNPMEMGKLTIAEIDEGEKSRILLGSCFRPDETAWRLPLETALNVEQTGDRAIKLAKAALLKQADFLKPFGVIASHINHLWLRSEQLIGAGVGYHSAYPLRKMEGGSPMPTEDFWAQMMALKDASDIELSLSAVCESESRSRSWSDDLEPSKKAHHGEKSRAGSVKKGRL